MAGLIRGDLLCSWQIKCLGKRSDCYWQITTSFGWDLFPIREDPSRFIEFLLGWVRNERKKPVEKCKRQLGRRWGLRELWMQIFLRKTNVVVSRSIFRPNEWYTKNNWQKIDGSLKFFSLLKEWSAYQNGTKHTKEILIVAVKNRTLLSLDCKAFLILIGIPQGSPNRWKRDLTRPWSAMSSLHAIYVFMDRFTLVFAFQRATRFD